MGQAYASAYTSVNKNKVPVLFTLAQKTELLKPGMRVLDYGCGRWPEVVREFLATSGIDDVVSYDPYWFPIPWGEGYDLACLSNVLNVIDTGEDRAKAVRNAWESLKPGGRMLVTVYEGDGSGKPAPSLRGSWQERRKLLSYMDGELARYFGEILPGTGDKLWVSMPKPAEGEKWYPPVGAKVTLRLPTGAEYPYTVVGFRKGRVVIRRCSLVFYGPRTNATVASAIVPGQPGNDEIELVWRPKWSVWHGKGRYGGYPVWGVWVHTPYDG